MFPVIRNNLTKFFSRPESIFYYIYQILYTGKNIVVVRTADLQSLGQISISLSLAAFFTIFFVDNIFGQLVVYLKGLSPAKNNPYGNKIKLTVISSVVVLLIISVVVFVLFLFVPRILGLQTYLEAFLLCLFVFKTALVEMFRLTLVSSSLSRNLNLFNLSVVLIEFLAILFPRKYN